LNKKSLPANGVWTLAVVAIIIGAFFPFAFLAQLISAGTLIAFMFVSVGIYALRRRQGKDLPEAAYKMPFYPVLPALGFLGSLFVFWGLDPGAKLYSGAWFVLGLIVYFAYSRNHEKNKMK
jgi:APA family basic amino acid/polyamine antiporter